MVSAQPSRNHSRHSEQPRRHAEAGGAPLNGRRRLIAELIGATERPLSVSEIAERVDLHSNTVRFHLDALVASGQVERILGPPTGPGRPPQLFGPRRGMDRNGPRSYRLLAEIGIGAIAADPDPVAKAVQLGQAWGGFLVEQPPPDATATEDAAVRRVVDMLAELGFAPVESSSASGRQIGLRNCPFLELVEGQPQRIICALHLGLMQGALAAVDATTKVDRLEPFAEPELCLAHLNGDATR